MRYFLTGGTGFIGGRVARQLLEAGHQITALVRSPDRASDLARLGATLAAGDVTDKESMRAPMADADGVFHLAAWYKVGARERTEAERINVGGTRNVLELMRELRIPKGVYTSTVAVFSDTRGQLVDETYRQDGPWLSEYDRTKWKAHYEMALPFMAEGLPLVIVQPGVNYGPGDTSGIGGMFVDYLRRRLPVIPAGAAYCWAHVDDTARGHLLAMDRGQPGQSYIVTGPAHSLVEAFQIAEQITGIPASRIHAPPALLRTLSTLVLPLERIVPLPTTMSSETLRVMAGVTYLGNSAKATRELGFSARPLREGLRELLAYEMERLGIRPGPASNSP